MTPWDEMKAYVGFGEADAHRLRALLPYVKPELPGITERFYDTIMRFSRARSVFENPAQIERAKCALREWMIELLQGPHDQVYWERRQKIGRTHFRVGLPQRYMFTAMNRLRGELTEIAFRCLCEDARYPTVRAIERVTDLDLAIMVSTFWEVHEAGQLRSLQDLIVRNLPVTVLCLDKDGRVTAATRPSARLFGEKAELGRSYDEFMPPDLIEASDLPTHVGRALATGENVSIPRVAVGTGGDLRYFRVDVVPLNHELAQALVHIEDLTEAVQAEARAQQAEALARIGSLAAAVAHEIRNPLAAISATLQVIGGSLDPGDRRREVLGKVQHQVLRLDRLVSDLLGYARPARPKLQRLDLYSVVRESVAQSGVAANLQEEGRVEVMGDPQFIQQIVVNLLQNARDAAGDDGAVTVRVGPGPVVTVQDDGPGIALEVAETLFEPFVTTKAKGTGLGLAICRKLARSMEGDVILTHLRPGATFRLSLPIAPPKDRTSQGDSARHSD